MKIPTKDPRWNGMHAACLANIPPNPVGTSTIAGTAVENEQVVSWYHVLGNVSCWRLHFESSADGTLSAQYIAAGYSGLDASGAVDTAELLGAGNPTNVTVTGGTDTLMEEDQHFGEYAVLFTFTAGEAGTISRCDISGINPALF